MSYVAAMARSVAITDRSRLRGWSALRRGALVMLTLIVGAHLLGPEQGAVASVASLFVGLQDRSSDPPRYTVRVMLAESALLAAAVALAGVVPGPITFAVVLTACAFLAGIAAQHDKAISRMFADVITVAAFLGLTQTTATEAAGYALAVFLAGLAQAVVTWAALPLQSDLAQRRPVAGALRAVADHLDDAQRRTQQGTGEAAEAALADADDAIGRSDLSHARRRALRTLIGDAEALRQEASSLRTRRAFGTAVIDEPEVDEAVGIAAQVLRRSAGVLATTGTPVVSGRRRDAALAELAELGHRADAIASDRTLRPSARAIARAAQRTVRHLGGLVATSPTRESDPGMHVHERLLDDLRHPGASDLRAGIRLALAAALGLLAAATFDLAHGGWVAATSVALLRPDHRALTADTTARAVGTGLGAALVIPLVALVSESQAASTLMVGILAAAAFAVTAANEGLFAIAMTVETVFTRAVIGEDPVLTATDRFFDVVVGCAIAMLLLALLPLKRGRRLTRDLAEYAAATAAWLTFIATPHRRGSAGEVLRETMRRRRVSVQSGLDVRTLEPLGPGVPPWWGYNLFERIHDAERASVAAEASIQHGAPDSEAAAALARAAAGDLARVAQVLAASPGAEPPPVALIDVAEPTGVEELLKVCRREAFSARAMAENPTTAF